MAAGRFFSWMALQDGDVIGSIDLSNGDEGAAIGFLIAIPVGPAAALCIRRSITVGAMAGYMTGIGAALGDAVFGAVAAFGLSFVEKFVAEREAWLLGIGGIVLVIMGWTTMRHRPRSVGDPVADDREHQVTTHLHYASSSFFITVFNPVTVMAFGAALFLLGGDEPRFVVGEIGPVMRFNRGAPNLGPRLSVLDAKGQPLRGVPE